ncbi:unnamed protein product [Paramecium octaurelia]|uniref:Uncharacterized protein n=1 Tax=Paramecium octaurelia TaxID=43137 RepID=A0A8S1SHG0_PAROT|nr:unnamed protein product [Paramecium octaurelia]
MTKQNQQECAKQSQNAQASHQSTQRETQQIIQVNMKNEMKALCQNGKVYNLDQQLDLRIINRTFQTNENQNKY